MHSNPDQQINNFRFMNYLSFTCQNTSDLNRKVTAVLKEYKQRQHELNETLTLFLGKEKIEQLATLKLLLPSCHNNSPLLAIMRQGSFHIIQENEQTFYVPLYLLAKAATGQILEEDVQWLVQQVTHLQNQNKEKERTKSLHQEAKSTFEQLDVKDKKLANLEDRLNELKTEYTDISRCFEQIKKENKGLVQKNQDLRNELKASFIHIDSLENQIFKFGNSIKKATFK
jgi:hypothetical protein